MALRDLIRATEGLIGPDPGEIDRVAVAIEGIGPSAEEQLAMDVMRERARALNDRRDEILAGNPFARDNAELAAIEEQIAEMRDDPLTRDISERQKAGQALNAEYRSMTGADYGMPLPSPEQRMANIAGDALGRFRARRSKEKTGALRRMIASAATGEQG